MADTATAATTAAANKKKCRNKNQKSQQQQQQKTEATLGKVPSNGHIQADEDAEADADADVALINGIMQQVQLCNGHAKDAKLPATTKGKPKAETVVAIPTVAATLNGHVKKNATAAAANHNNNHLNNNNNSSNSNNNTSSNNNNNVNSSSSKNNNNNNNSRGSKAKNNKSSQAAAEEQQKEQQQATSVTGSATVMATSNSTANTQTTSATTTKTTAMAIATRGNPPTTLLTDEAPTTSAAAAAAATQPQSQTQPQTQPELEVPQLELEPAISADEIVYKEYEAEYQMHDIMRLIQAELSEPYSIYTYRYFIYNWPKLCFLASHDNQYVGAIVCKLDMHMNVRRGYIAMLAVRKEYRKLKIGTTLVTKAIEAMLADNADEVVLETEMRNEPALRLYENLGFVRDKRLFRYYLNGVDALRLKLWFR
ncbi:N-alpha-acetyltransferase 30A [Drosophila sulfurigaster albostrigata]|uniref:N-alpha-acetyltransferase 30A n=1 Tax=Drosophila sulfurigaster albostrigata TaxID=89887 RepID=UPI002D21DAB8|nr:N-alpha-acetyltransferase 30A [Drosophila sulfurigaster albostrigata]XP_062138209.1 N-alpha-acetyltransferase 30A [Drosophila sulfurigaster albostrigata]XP_062138210.1 N-alpha-acetyltransferase 30A [Drosophila sulfurigaster albostrigata]XP_062138211.1 N-alpha-acetyltransferase 30A [Drosophila sulfurigaster albostrigata]